MENFTGSYLNIAIIKSTNLNSPYLAENDTDLWDRNFDKQAKPVHWQIALDSEFNEKFLIKLTLRFIEQVWYCWGLFFNQRGLKLSNINVIYIFKGSLSQHFIKA